jgi:predicted glycoside hydrolase/deacetylase ChbG (UPF0249 family)
LWAAAASIAPLLIVNADDWGIDEPTTDAIARCVAAGRVSSVTAMVWMADEERAAAIARERGIPTGLHLNLIEPYTGADVPPEARERQARIARWLGRSRWRRWLPALHRRRDIRRSVEDQLDRFRELYGADPTHIDGHQHFHLNPAVLPALPEGMAVRSSFTFLPDEKPWPNRAARALTNRAIARRHRTTDWFFSIRRLNQEKLALARHETVEVMCHPGWHDEYELLTSDDWGERTAGLRLGSYAELL